MVRWIATLLIFLLCATTTRADHGWVTAEEVAAAVNGDTCKHYVNRARFKHRHPDQEFVVTLADGCLSAKASLNAQNPKERVAAKEFLIQLRTLRDLIIDMNMERAFGKTYKPRTRMSYGVGSMEEPVPRVSALGEYMIARELGLLAAYRSWLSTGPVLTLAHPKGLTTDR